MASIRKREGVRGTSYQLMYRDRAGKQRSETFTRRRDAVARKGEVEVEVRTGTYVEPRHGRTTFGAWYERWEPTRRVSKTRAAADRCYRDGHVLPRWHSVPLDAITYTDAQAWVNGLADQLAPATVAACFRLLKLPLEAAVRDGKLRANPVSAVKLPTVQRRRKGDGDVLTAVELQEVANRVPDRYRALVLVAGWLGLRWGEALGIRRRDVNLLRRQLTVGEWVVIEIARHTEPKEGPKSESSRRTVPLPRPIADALGEHLATICPDAGPDDFIFRTSSGTAPMRSNFARKVLRPALTAAGCADRGITFHKLRHTAASLMLDAGLDVQDVQERLGHADPAVTMGVYAHLFKARRDAGTDALEQAIMRAASGSA